MTTIAYRSGVLAADSRETDNELILNNSCQKLWRLPDKSLLGAANSSESCEMLYLAMKKKQQIPKLEDITAILVSPKGALSIFEGHIWVPLKDKYYAIGSGATAAFSALDAGASAIEAVRVGINRDPYSGGAVRYLTIPNRGKK